MTLVEREGDPLGALALAVAHDFGSEASVALSVLLEARLDPLGFPHAESRAHASGFELTSLVASPKRASAFIEAVQVALQAPVRRDEPALERVAAALTSYHSKAWIGPADAPPVSCSGELGGVPSQARIDLTSAEGRALFERSRRAVYGRHASLSALGRRPLLEAAEEALGDLPEWPEGIPPRDPWPKGDSVSVADGPNLEPGLSVALRVPEVAPALVAARALAGRASDLTLRLRALSAGLVVERVVGSARPRGGCLRVDLALTHARELPLDAAAWAVFIVEDEMRRALGRATLGDGALEDAALRASDPRDAASTAAWNALSGSLKPGPIRLFANASGVSSEPSPDRQPLRGKAFESALQGARQNAKTPPFELRTRVEAGQGELWMLLGSACAPLPGMAEHEVPAALLLRTVAVGHDRAGGVRLEPWVAPDGVGLLAHAPRSNPGESAYAQAERVARHLGRALLSDVGSGSFLRARATLLDELGPGPRPGFWLLLDRLAPDHVSSLEPRGSWQQLTEAAADGASRQRSQWLASSLRLAVLGSYDDRQVELAQSALARFINPSRPASAECPEQTPPKPVPGEYVLETREPEPVARAFVGVRVAPGALSEAQATEFLLNRPNGFLDAGLGLVNDSGLGGRPLAASGLARFLSGGPAASLVIELRAEREALRAAVEQVRGLLTRLSEGHLTEQDARAATRELAHRARSRALDPRGRIVKLWRGNGAQKPLTRGRLQRFLKSLANAHVVVYVEPEPD